MGKNVGDGGEERLRSLGWVHQSGQWEMRERQEAVLGKAGSGLKHTLDEILNPALSIGPCANCFSSLSLFSYL